MTTTLVNSTLTGTVISNVFKIAESVDHGYVTATANATALQTVNGTIKLMIQTREADGWITRVSSTWQTTAGQALAVSISSRIDGVSGLQCRVRLECGGNTLPIVVNLDT